MASEDEDELYEHAAYLGVDLDKEPQLRGYARGSGRATATVRVWAAPAAPVPADW